jgi:hypothetical protein
VVVWRRRIDNDWLYRAQTIVEGIVSRPEEYDEPTCGPGPFSMADADTTTDILLRSASALSRRRAGAAVLSTRPPVDWIRGPRRRCAHWGSSRRES